MCPVTRGHMEWECRSSAVAPSSAGTGLASSFPSRKTTMFKVVLTALLAAAFLTQYDQAMFNGRHIDGAMSFAREIKRGFGF